MGKLCLVIVNYISSNPSLLNASFNEGVKCCSINSLKGLSSNLGFLAFLAAGGLAAALFPDSEDAVLGLFSSAIFILYSTRLTAILHKGRSFFKIASLFYQN